jgi:hypothetical protein
MAGPTDVLTEDVKELRAVNRDLTDEFKRVFDRLSGEIRDSNQHLADAINRLGGEVGNFRVDIAKDLGAINATIQTLKGDVARDLGGINANLENFKGRMEADLSVARWAVGVITVVVLGLVAWSYSAYARAVPIEESIVTLRELAKEQDSRIAKLIELQHDGRIFSPPPLSHSGGGGTAGGGTTPGVGTPTNEGFAPVTGRLPASETEKPQPKPKGK